MRRFIASAVVSFVLTRAARDIWGTECDLRAQKVDLNHQTRKVTVRPLSRCGFVASDWGTKCGFWALYLKCYRAQGTWVSRFTSLSIMQGLGIVLLYLLQGLGACFVGILFQGHGTLIRCDPLVALLQGTQERCQHCKHLSYNISAWGVGVDGSRCGCNGHGWCSWPWSGWSRWGAVIHYDAATGFGGRTSGISTRSGAQGKEREEGQGCQK